MTWIKNLIEYLTTGDNGKCPSCSSSDLNVETMSFGRCSITFQCNKCVAARHFDGVSISSKERFYGL